MKLLWLISKSEAIEANHYNDPSQHEESKPKGKEKMINTKQHNAESIVI